LKIQFELDVLLKYMQQVGSFCHVLVSKLRHLPINYIKVATGCLKPTPDAINKRA
jgi:hypothetical protein